MSGSMPSLGSATSTHLDSACKHIQQCRVSQDHMVKFTKAPNDPDELIRNKYRYCIHKDELVLGVGKPWAADGKSKRFQNNAYPRVVSNLGQLAEVGVGADESDAVKLIKLMYHFATSIPVRNHLLIRFQKGLSAEFPGAGPNTYLSPSTDQPQVMGFKETVPNLFDFVTVGYANTLGWAHAHCGDTMTSVMIGGLRTVLNGDFEVHTGDMVQWYWPFERDCFTQSGARKQLDAGAWLAGGIPAAYPRDSTQFNLLVDPARGQADHGVVVDRGTTLRDEFHTRQYGQKKGVSKVVPLVKPYKRDDDFPRIYDWYRVFAVALSTARPRELLDIRISRQAL